MLYFTKHFINFFTVWKNAIIFFTWNERLHIAGKVTALYVCEIKVMWSGNDQERRKVLSSHLITYSSIISVPSKFIIRQTDVDRDAQKGAFHLGSTAAMINILAYRKKEKIMCNAKGVTCNDKLTVPLITTDHF